MCLFRPSHQAVSVQRRMQWRCQAASALDQPAGRHVRRRCASVFATRGQTGMRGKEGGRGGLDRAGEDCIHHQESGVLCIIQSAAFEGLHRARGRSTTRVRTAMRHPLRADDLPTGLQVLCEGLLSIDQLRSTNRQRMYGIGREGSLNLHNAIVCGPSLLAR